jgi:hypothetical protein
VDPTGHEGAGLAAIFQGISLPAIPALEALAAALLVVFAVVVLWLDYQNLRCAVALPYPGCGGRTGGDTSELDRVTREILKQVAKLTAAAAAAAAAACLASFAAGQLVGLGDNPCSGDKFPVFFSGYDNPKTTDNVHDAIWNDHRPAVLNYAKARPRTGWYNSTPTCEPIARYIYGVDNGGDTGVCDEYPFNSTTQNQQNLATVTLKLVPSEEGPIQRDALNNFYTGCRVADDQVFGVVPVQVPLVPSFGLCRRGT